MSQNHEIHAQFSVPFDYRVIFTDGVFEPANPTLSTIIRPPPDAATPLRIAVFIDSQCSEANPSLIDTIHRSLTRFCSSPNAAPASVASQPPTVQIIPGGEIAKRDGRIVDRCIRTLHDLAIDRHSYVIAVGGGAVLDAVGYAASVVHRGIRHLRIPTTVLAQNDAGVGIKNGIDYLGKKNFLGCFQPPVAVINDFQMLRTLSPASRSNGYSEAVKVALLRDPMFFEWIEAHVTALSDGEEQSLRHLIRRCGELHLQHITTGGDPFERGSARPLDFGHWAAHKLEQLSDYRLPHGHAVAVGLAIDILYAKETNLLPEKPATRILNCLRNLGFDFAVGPKAKLSPSDLSPLLGGLTEFQQHLGGRLSITTLTDIGRPIELNAIELPVLARCISNVLFHSNGLFQPS